MAAGTLPAAESAAHGRNLIPFFPHTAGFLIQGCVDIGVMLIFVKKEQKMKLSEEKQAEKKLKAKVADVEKAERRLSPKEKLDLGFGRRGIAVTVTLVSCVLIVCGGMYLVSHLRYSEKYYELPDNILFESTPAVQTATVSAAESGLIYNRPAEKIQNNMETEDIIATSPVVTEKNPAVTTADSEETPVPAKTTSQSVAESTSERLPPSELPTIPERGYNGELLFG